MRIIQHIKNHEYIFSFTAIFLVVTTSNLHSVFGLDMLLHDDNYRYYLIVNDSFTIPDFRSMTDLLWLHVKFISIIFSTYSVEIARLYILLAYMVPLSCLLYLFNRKFLHLPIWVSLASAVTINIIPNLYQVPAFLDGSYTVTGMLAFVLTLISTSLYLGSPRPNLFLLSISLTGWFLACDLMNEMGILLFPAFLYFIYSSDATLKRKSYLYVMASLIASYRLYIYFQLDGVPSNKPNALSIQIITDRIFKTIEWWLPVSTRTSVAIALGLIVVAMLFYAYKKSRSTPATRISITRVYIFYAIWFLACSSPFWFLTRFFSPRHLYISYIALTTMTFIAVYQLFIMKMRYRQQIAVFSLVLIFSLYGTQRYLLNKEKFIQWNKTNSEIYTLLNREAIHDDTQFALVNINNGTGGLYYWSSGYLQYLLKKPGIRGLMGNEFNFYDPFNSKHCGFRFTMSCLNTSKELIAFKKNEHMQTMRMKYFLQWKDKGKRDSDWLLYKSDEYNRISVVSTGTGIDSYIGLLTELSLAPEQVLWGNYNDKKSLAPPM